MARLASVVTALVLVGCGRISFDAQGLDAAPDGPSDAPTGPNLLTNPSFESTTNWPEGWFFQVVDPAAGTLTRDTTTLHSGAASAHAVVTAVDGTEFHVQLKQAGLALTAGVSYVFTLWLRADRSYATYLTGQQDHPNYDLWGLQNLVITTEWQSFSLTFSPPTNDSGLVSIMLGTSVGEIWIDDASVVVAP